MTRKYSRRVLLVRRIVYLVSFFVFTTNRKINRFILKFLLRSRKLFFKEPRGLGRAEQSWPLEHERRKLFLE